MHLLRMGLRRIHGPCVYHIALARVALKIREQEDSNDKFITGIVRIANFGQQREWPF